MSKTKQKDDPVRGQIEDALEEYVVEHPGAKFKVKRQNSVAIRIRVTGPAFRGMDRLKREEQVWEFLDKLPDKARSQITFVLLLTPEEERDSLLNQEFERPTRSRL